MTADSMRLPQCIRPCYFFGVHAASKDHTSMRAGKVVMSLLVIVTSHRCPFLLVMEGHFIFTSEIGLFVSKLLSQSKDNGGSIQSPRLTSPVISYCCNQQKQWRDFFSAGKRGFYDVTVLL